MLASYIEIYNEEIRDLLNPSSNSIGGLKIVDSPQLGPLVKGVTEEVVYSAERCYELLAIGEANRRISTTAMNYRSSRSHALFKLSIESNFL